MCFSKLLTMYKKSRASHIADNRNRLPKLRLKLSHYLLTCVGIYNNFLASDVQEKKEQKKILNSSKELYTLRQIFYFFALGILVILHYTRVYNRSRGQKKKKMKNIQLLFLRHFFVILKLAREISNIVLIQIVLYLDKI